MTQSYSSFSLGAQVKLRKYTWKKRKEEYHTLIDWHRNNGMREKINQ